MAHEDDIRFPSAHSKQRVENHIKSLHLARTAFFLTTLLQLFRDIFLVALVILPVVIMSSRGVADLEPPQWLSAEYQVGKGAIFDGDFAQSFRRKGAISIEGRTEPAYARPHS